MKHQRKVNKNKLLIVTIKILLKIQHPELPQYPNVDPFNYETMKKMLIEKLDSFAAAPFTIQRISELLSDPRKQYSRIDKFMRAVEKTILVVSTTPPGRHRSESENGDSLDSGMNGDFASEVNVDVDMEQGETFAMTKELAVAANCKEPNHEVSEIGKDTTMAITKDESPTKMDEKTGTSETSDEKKTIDKEEKTIANDSKETKTETETTDSKASAPSKPESPKASLERTQVSTDQETTETISVSVNESKPDEVMSNEPLRSDENEILVDTSEIVSETTPLAALENIVAIRTEPVVESESPSNASTIVVPHEPETNENRDEVIVQAPRAEEEDSAIEAKRLKISEVNTCIQEEKVSNEVVVQQEPVVEPSVVVATVETLTAEEQNEAPSTPSVEEVPDVTPAIEESEVIAEPVAVEKIEEPQLVIAEIPQEIITPIIPETTEAPAAEMETVPIITENKMSLDEDEPPAIELEMTTSVNKMDTDEAEAAPMDFEDEAEPMDQ